MRGWVCGWGVGEGARATMRAHNPALRSPHVYSTPAPPTCSTPLARSRCARRGAKSADSASATNKFSGAPARQATGGQVGGGGSGASGVALIAAPQLLLLLLLLCRPPLTREHRCRHVRELVGRQLATTRIAGPTTHSHLVCGGQNALPQPRAVGIEARHRGRGAAAAARERPKLCRAAQHTRAFNSRHFWWWCCPSEYTHPHIHSSSKPCSSTQHPASPPTPLGADSLSPRRCRSPRAAPLQALSALGLAPRPSTAAWGAGGRACARWPTWTRRRGVAPRPPRPRRALRGGDRLWE